jgi:hypothetical protein
MEKSTLEKSYNHFVFLLVLIAIGLIIRITQHYGFLGTDDSVITTNALRILHEGMYTPFTHYDSRLGLILPVYFIFELFGTGVMQSSLFPIIAFLILPLVLYKIGIQIGLAQRYAFLAGLVVLLTPINIAFGSSNYPEVPFAMAISTAIYFLLKSNIHLVQQNTQWISLGIAVLFLFWAYLIKIEIIFVLAGLSFFFLLNRKYMLGICLVLSPLIFMIAEDLLFYMSTTDLSLNRLDILTSGRDASTKTASHGATQLWVFPKSMFITFYNFGLLFYFALWSCFLYFKNFIKYKNHLIGLFVFAFIAFFIWLQFGTSPKLLIKFFMTGTLNTKSHLDRYLIMLLPFISLMIAYAAQNKSWISANFKPSIWLAALLLSMVACIPLNDISQEYALAYNDTQSRLNEMPAQTIYCDKATCTYYTKLKEFGEFKQLTFENVVVFEPKSGVTKNNPNFTQNGGLVLINKNRYLYYNRRYTIKYPTLESLKQHASYEVVSSNPGMPISYMYLNIINQMLNLMPQDNYLVSKAEATVVEALDKEDILLFDVTAENASMLEYIK